MSVSIINVYERLCSCEKTNNWDSIPEFLQPKYFHSDENIDIRLLAKVAKILTNANFKIPRKIQILLLKCLVNCCVKNFKYKPYYLNDGTISKYETEIYDLLSDGNNMEKIDKTYPIETHFPLDGVSQWAVDYLLGLIDKESLTNEELEILTQCMQFLSNFVSFACKTSNAPDLEEAPSHLNSEKLKNAIVFLIGHEHMPVARAACCFVFNTNHHNDISDTKECEFLKNLIHASRLEINAALEIINYFIVNTKNFEQIYENLSIDDKLYILQVIHENLLNETYQSISTEMTKFIIEKFKRKSDLILKTVDTYLDGMQPMEVMILLDILGVLSSRIDDSISSFLRQDRSLLINGLYLLKSIHMVGRETDNYFTPLQKLSDVAPNAQGSSTSKNDFEAHPAYGFKAGLVRLIGNLAFENEDNQNFIREEEGIPLLLDCCNIDARNPLIIQWVILAIKNLCSKNERNQEVIQECTKIGVVDSSTLKEMGLTLHEEEDGKAIGIVPILL
ncbi:ataxin-10 [Leptopilina heterotoma]|uniref:ataxin-10 n=1 Tax=Leptopilina heterotoma TaxID=63436 RepID=UPI001CA8A226|nr:ataxin-10 [Leptopilina heterotoma]